MARQRLLPVAAIFVLCVSGIEGFSRGSLLVTGNTAARKMYCNRPVLHRPPVHIKGSCGGLCAPRPAANLYTIDLHVNHSTYWTNGFDITLRAVGESALSVTGFSLVAVDQMGNVAGVFTGSDDVLVGTCERVVHNAVEGQYVVHAKAQHGRRNITVTWTPDGYNHEKVKFHAWVVHNHSSIFYVESEEIDSQKHGTTTLDVDAIFQDLMGNALASMNEFEQTFEDRQTLGYNIELDDPFQPFNEDPSQRDLVPGFGEPKIPSERGWLSSYSHMLNAIDTGGVFKWSDMLGSARGHADNILDDAAYSSGLIGAGLGGFEDLGNEDNRDFGNEGNKVLGKGVFKSSRKGYNNNLANVNPVPVSGLKDSSSVDRLQNMDGNSSDVNDLNILGTDGINKSINENATESDPANATESFNETDVSISTVVSDSPGENLDQGQLRQLPESNTSSGGSQMEVEGNGSKTASGIFGDPRVIKTGKVIPAGQSLEALDLTSKSDNNDENMTAFVATNMASEKDRLVQMTPSREEKAKRLYSKTQPQGLKS
ncbi:hypothetical protein EGW08_021200 [Elysia chlorotica]|uniref:Reelin domain-containing protein n=1 Tax=Elysia chlorotica TaxID=188477 RepID=A0A433SPH5_ELYCH|nr:hypothetical protein EGW08_021200 [Elysia chlorotica]